MATDRLIESYVTTGQHRIEGWLDPYSADFVRAVSEIQRRARIVGAVGEIGVHHGRLFLLLMLGRGPGEKAFAVDVFDHQDRNLDRSGLGDRDVFEANIRRWGGRVEEMCIIAASSLTLRPDDIIGPCGRVRLASIDGGHTSDCVLNDLRLIDAVLADAGVAVIDDYFNPEWPGVSTGVAQFLLPGEARIRPFAISPNKLYCCDPRWADFYRAKIASYGGFNRAKSSVLFGSEVDVYVGPPAPPPLPVYIKERLRRTRLAPYLLAAKGWVRGQRRPGRSLSGPPA